jgi:hypothetical protein
MVDATLVAMVAEYYRRKLAARIAINTGGIDKKIAADVLRQPLKKVCHIAQAYFA